MGPDVIAPLNPKLYKLYKSNFFRKHVKNWSNELFMTLNHSNIKLFANKNVGTKMLLDIFLKWQKYPVTTVQHSKELKGKFHI